MGQGRGPGQVVYFHVANTLYDQWAVAWVGRSESTGKGEVDNVFYLLFLVVELQRENFPLVDINDTNVSVIRVCLLA